METAHNCSSSSEPTLTEALLARGYAHRPVANGAHEIVRVSDSVVVTTLRAAEAWDWVHAFDRAIAKEVSGKRHRHDFRDGDVCASCDEVRS